MNFKYVDTHCHLNFKDFKDDGDEVIKRTLEGETAMILIGSEQKTNVRAVEYANKYESGVYSAIGLHPIHLEDFLVENHDENGDYKFVTKAEDFDYDNYYNLGKNNSKVVAIGEVGLDYYHLPTDKDINEIKAKQKQVFEAQLLLAHNLGLPVIVHCREAHEDLLPILINFKNKYKADWKLGDREWGVIHCFSGDAVLSEKYIKLGLMVSFTGLITFAKSWDELIKTLPLEKIMIETDSPYMAPVPYRGKRCEPLYVKEVARKIANLRGVDIGTVARATTDNAKRVFNLDI